MSSIREQITSHFGVNIVRGSDDDGWQPPAPVLLADSSYVQLYKDGEALKAAYDAIDNAHSRIWLEVYIFASDETGLAFADLLCKKARQGLGVHVIYDSFGSLAADREMFRRMVRSGVRLQQFHPIRPWECHFSYRPVNRNHRKLICIDNDIAWLGGLNVASEYSGSWIASSSKHKRVEAWRDNAIGIRGPSALHFQCAFARSWNYCVSGGRIGRAQYFRELSPGDQPEVGALASVPTTNSPLRPQLHRILRSAKKSIQLTIAYFAPDDELVDELLNAARRGARVQLMLPSRSDVHLLQVAARSFYETLLTAGVEVYERRGVVLHAKTMCIDRTLTIIGSTNLDYRSIEYNLELSAILRSHELGEQMNTLFEHDVKFANKIDLARWRHRPWLDRVGQWAVSRARYLL